jgi:hypothetical protein
LVALQKAIELREYVICKACVHVLNRAACQWLGLLIVNIIVDFLVLRHRMSMPDNFPAAFVRLLGHNAEVVMVPEEVEIAPQTKEV